MSGPQPARGMASVTSNSLSQQEGSSAVVKRASMTATVNVAPDIPPSGLTVDLHATCAFPIATTRVSLGKVPGLLSGERRRECHGGNSRCWELPAAQS